MIASSSDVRDLSSEIVNLCYHLGITVEEAGARIESKMDGSQPLDLVERAVARAREIRSASK